MNKQSNRVAPDCPRPYDAAVIGAMTLCFSSRQSDVRRDYCENGKPAGHLTASHPIDSAFSIPMPPSEITSASLAASAMLKGASINSIRYLGAVIEVEFSRPWDQPEAWSYDHATDRKTFDGHGKLVLATDVWTQVAIGPPPYRNRRDQAEDRITVVAMLCRMIGERITHAEVTEDARLEFVLGGSLIFTELEICLKSYGDELWELRSFDEKHEQAEWYVGLNDDQQLFSRTPSYFVMT